MVGSCDVHSWFYGPRDRGQKHEDWTCGLVGLLCAFVFVLVFIFILLPFIKLGEAYDWSKRRNNPKAQ